MPTTGILYVAYGGTRSDDFRRHLVGELDLSLASVKATMPDLPVALITDAVIAEMVAGQPLDHVIVRDLPDVGWSWTYKIDALAQTPFAHTIFLDTDTYLTIPSPILKTWAILLKKLRFVTKMWFRKGHKGSNFYQNRLFSVSINFGEGIDLTESITDTLALLDHFDLAATLAVDLVTGYYPPEYNIPLAFPELSTGVLVYRQSPAMMRLFERWSALHAEHETRGKWTGVRQPEHAAHGAL